MSGRKAPTVFVGNIPYDATEEQLKEKFSEAGPVIAFRLVHDRDTGKPKGFGFCEYMDEESAKCAMRNLHNTEFGGRHLRVDYQGDERKEGHAGPGSGGGGAGSGPVSSGVASASASAGSVANMTPEQALKQVTEVANGLDEERIMELLMQFKFYVHAMPDQARYLLLQNPQLSFLLVQAALRIGLLDKSQADAMLTVDGDVETGAPTMPPGREFAGVSPSGLAGGMVPGMGVPMAGMQPGVMPPRGFPMGMVPPAFMPLMNAAMFAAMRPPMMPMGVSPPSAPLPPQMPTQPFGQAGAVGMGGPAQSATLTPGVAPAMPQPPMTPEQQAQHQLAGLSEEKRREYLELVLSLTPEDFMQLPVEQRESMLFLRREAEQLRRQR